MNMVGKAYDYVEYVGGRYECMDGCMSVKSLRYVYMVWRIVMMR